MRNLKEMADKDLYAKCKEYGSKARQWSREFAFLLPEVANRRLHRKYGCQSIHHFAGKLAGMSNDLVDRVLSLHSKLQNYPLLWAEFRKCGWTKLEVIARVIECESEKVWLDIMQKAPRRVLTEYVKKYLSPHNEDTLFDFVAKQEGQSTNLSSGKPFAAGTLELGNEATGRVRSEVTGLASPAWRQSELKNDETRLPQVPKFGRVKFSLDNDTEFKFRNFKKKLEKERKEAVTMGEALKALLEIVGSRGTEIERSKTVKSITSATTTRTRKTSESLDAHARSRYVTAEEQRVTIQKHQGKCAFPECNNPYHELHHPDRFSLKKDHHRLIALCKTHHQAAHAGLIINEEKPVQEWQLSIKVRDRAWFCDQKGIWELLELYQNAELVKITIDEKVREHWNS